MMADNKLPIKAWHASPFDFDRFGEMRQVSGKGQGAASYGRGAAYVAENPDVSGPGKSAYMREFHENHPAIARPDIVVPQSPEAKSKIKNPEIADQINDEVYHNPSYFATRPSDIGGLIHHVTRDLLNGRGLSTPDIVKYHNWLNWIADNQKHITIGQSDTPPSKGPFSYEVAVHLTPETTLDWDETLDNHHPGAAAKILESFGKAGEKDEDGAAFIPDSDGTKYNLHASANKGAELYKMLASHHGSDYAASEALYSAGIHGIRYLDGGSRMAPKSANALTFNGKPWVGLGSKNNPKLKGEDEVQFINLHHVVTNLGLATVSDIEAQVQKTIQANMVSNPHYAAAQRKTLDWYRNNLQNLGIEVKPASKPTYNYVVFHPDLLEILAQYDIKGDKVREFGPGVHLKSVDHDPFGGENR